MDCRINDKMIEDFFDGTLDTGARHALQMHIEACPVCRKRVTREEELRAALKDLPVPDAAPDFSERVFRNIRNRKARPRIRSSLAMRIAAGILAFIALGVLIKEISGPGRSALPEAHLALNQPAEVKMMFYSAKDLRDVTITLEPPPGVELLGFENRKKIAWNTDLEQGPNLLRLPVIARSQDGGSLTASLRHGGQYKEFGLLLKVQPPDAAAKPDGKLGEHATPINTI